MTNYRKLAGSACLMFFATALAYGSHSFYLGVNTGYASTDWTMLQTKDVAPVSFSSPIAVRDRGVTGGFEVGYWLNQQFAIQASFSIYADSRITFDPNNFYSPIISLISKTYSGALLGQFNVPINRKYAAYASVGIQDVHRHDVLAKTDHVGAIFGAGISANMNKRVQLKFNFDYYTGYGKADMRPVKYYVPFIYKVTLGADVFL